MDCLGEVAQYVYEKHGKFPGMLTTVVLPGFVQAHHIDTDFYDAHYQAGATWTPTPTTCRRGTATEPTDGHFEGSARHLDPPSAVTSEFVFSRCPRTCKDC